MLCEKCKKNQASVILTKTTPEGTLTQHLCPACSFKLVVPISNVDFFQELMGTIQQMVQNEADFAFAEKEKKCPVCGMTFEQYKETSRLGCADCYTTFSAELDVLLKNVQGNTRHEGKYPQRAGVELRQKREVDQLRGQLKKAVDKEDFEEAANLRDRIKLLEAQ